MIRRALLLLTVAGIYVWVKGANKAPLPADSAITEPTADARWANEGGGKFSFLGVRGRW